MNRICCSTIYFGLAPSTVHCMTNKANLHPIDSATRRCCGAIDTHARSAGHLILAAASPRPGTLRDVMTTYVDRLNSAGAFCHLPAEDAHVAAATIAWEVMHGDESPGLRRRAVVLLDGEWSWTSNPTAVAHTLLDAADVLDTLP